MKNTEAKSHGPVPCLRFPEFRDSGPWKVKRLGDVYRFKPTNSWPRNRLNYEAGTVRNIHYGDIHKGLNLTFRLAEEAVPFLNDELAVKLAKDVFCKPGDIVFADASEDVADIGKAIEIIDTGGENLVAGLHTILASQIEQRLSTGFGAYLFASSGIRTQIQERAQGAKVLGISKSQLAEVKLTYPRDVHEQQKIADCLSSLDDLIRTEGKRLETLKKYKCGLMQRLFPTLGKTTPDLRFPEFRDSGPWKVKRLGDVYRFKPTNSWPRNRLNYEAGTVRNIHYGDIHKGLNLTFRLAEEAVPFLNDELAVKLAKDVFCKPGDIVFADASEDVADIGKAIEIIDTGGENLVAGLHTILASQIEQRLSTGFGAYLFASSGIRTQIQERAQGAKVLGISKSQLAEVKLTYPRDVHEQQKIADCLSSLDDLIRTEGKRLETLKKYKCGLMQRLFPQEVS